MAVDNPDVIDIVSVEQSGCVVLTISDHLEWLDSTSHQQLLQLKINRYLAFVESGEILDSYPRAAGRDVIIRVVTQFRPDAAGLEFFERVGTAIAQTRLQFQVRQFESGGAA